jgi:methylmalonyl-CoA mutase C-terminal domain/subunit
MSGHRKIRVLIGKPGLDGHDRGAKVIARALRDAGMEVIYTGLHQTPEAIVKTAVEEDVDAVGLSVLSGAHNHLFPQVAELLRREGREDVVLFGGGIIPDQDVAALHAAGFRRLFTPGARTGEVVDWLQAEVAAKIDREADG